MKTQRYFENEKQRRSDKVDEIKADSIAISLAVFIILCLIFG